MFTLTDIPPSYLYQETLGGPYFDELLLNSGEQKMSQFALLFSYLVKSRKTYFFLLPESYLIMWLMKSPKSFEKIAILKI